MAERDAKDADLTSSELSSILKNVGKTIIDHEHRLSILDLLDICHKAKPGIIGECQIAWSWVDSLNIDSPNGWSTDGALSHSMGTIFNSPSMESSSERMDSIWWWRRRTTRSHWICSFTILFLHIELSRKPRESVCTTAILYHSAADTQRTFQNWHCCNKQHEFDTPSSIIWCRTESPPSAWRTSHKVMLWNNYPLP